MPSGNCISPPDEPNPDALRLADWLAACIRPGTAIICVGNDLRGDDGLGPAVAARLAGAVPWRVHDVQGSPESFLMKIAAEEPSSVVIIDAVDFGGVAGAIRLMPPGDVAIQGPSTHGPGLAAFLDALGRLCPCPQVIVGVQPAGLEFGQGLSQPAGRAVATIVQALQLLADAGSPQRTRSRTSPTQNRIPNSR